MQASMEGDGAHQMADSGSITATIHLIAAQGIGPAIGTITVADGGHGVMVMPDLVGLSPGLHAFHIHQNGDCRPGEKDGKMIAGLMAGGHYGHGSHGGDSHGKPKGDLPELVVADDGSATQPVMNPHLHAAELAGRSIMIHGASEAQGGGARVACGVFPK
ncbi:MAG: superoxide dismutase [Cu-Zn] SodC2 [Alphaproteobacteria bacterium]|nr:superoxide dismutase [Cu-Zn] SodC2 [Alphaproteobacteria bacterium]